MSFELFPVLQWLDNNGSPLAGGLISTFIAGTNTPQATYTDSTGLVPQANPVVLDSAGRAQIWFAPASYKLVLKTASGVTLMTIDNVTLDNLAATISSLSMTGTLTMQQPTAATAVANQSSNVYSLQGTFWNGAASATDTWQLQNVLGAGPNPTSTLTVTHNGSSGAASFSIPGNFALAGNFSVGGTLAVTGALTPSNINGRIFVDGVKYAFTAAGVQSAINDAISNGTFEVWLPPRSININTTLTITSGPFALRGASGGDVNAAGNGISALVYTGAAGSDLLQITGGATRLAGIRLENLMLDGAGLARYALRMVKQDASSLINVKIRSGSTANWYCADTTGINSFNTQLTLMATGGTGLVLDAGCSIFNAFEISFDSANGNTGTGVQLWIGGGDNRSINFFGGQFNINTATPVGFIKIAAFDTAGSSPWAGAPSVAAGAPDNVNFYGTDFLYGSGSPAGASQGADVLIDGTATNPATNINFINCKFDATGSASGAIAIKTDHATNVKMIGGFSAGHATATITNTANSSTVGMFLVSSSDSARTGGAGAIMDISQSAGGILQSQLGFLGALLTSMTANPATAGLLRLAKTDVVAWRNNANSGNLPVGIDANDQMTWPNRLKIDTLRITGATFGAAVNELGLGMTNGFGNGAAGTAVTTTLKNTGTGPATPQTVVKYLNINIGGTDFWVPLMQ